ncbi:MAG: hypothetical protein U0869_03915 [Chloroflexota bacterium]
MGEFDLSIGGAMVIIVTISSASLVIVNNQPGWIALPIGLIVDLGLGLVTQGVLIFRLTRSFPHGLVHRDPRGHDGVPGIGVVDAL